MVPALVYFKDSGIVCFNVGFYIFSGLVHKPDATCSCVILVNNASLAKTSKVQIKNESAVWDTNFTLS